MSNSNFFLRVSEATEAVNSLKMVERFLNESDLDYYNLKWALLATHNALQAYMVLVLHGSNSLNLIEWKDDYTGKDGYEICSDPNPKMLSFLELFRKIKTIKYMEEIPFLDKSGTITFCIKELNRIRTEFIHYLPKRWSIYIPDLLIYILNALKVIDFLIDSPRLSTYFSEEETKELKRLVFNIQNHVQTLVNKVVTRC